MVDFDLILFDERTGAGEPTLLVASQMLDDTNEGFDYVLTTNADDVHLAYIRPKRVADETECRRNGADFEPYAYSILWWE
jgi:hypothetical protein